MVCLKCGTEIDESQVFCDECLEIMKKYPVKPATAIQLPRRGESTPVKKTYVKRRQPPSQEEQNRVLRKIVLFLAVFWLITAALLALTLRPALESLFQGESLLPGQNYSTFADAPEP